MKNTFHLCTCLLLLSLFLVFYPLSGQICVPVLNGSAQGIFPETLPEVCLGAYYEETVSVRVPLDTLVSVGGNTVLATIDSLVLDNIVGIPPGLSYDCLTPFCQTMGGSSSCLLIYGTPSQVGSFPLDIYLTYYAKVGGASVSRADTLLAYYTVLVNNFQSSTSTVSAMCGNANGSASISISGTPPYTYLWNTGATTASVNNLSPGQYIIEASDANTCSIRDTLTVNNVGESPQILRNKVAWEGCEEDGAGVIELSINGGKPGYMYAWSHGPSSQDLTQLAAGRYTLTVSDADNCMTNETFTITAPSPLDLSTLIQTNVLCAGDNTGSVSTLISGGLAPYDISWNTTPPVSSSLLNNLEAGVYTLSVGDSLGCQKDLAITITEPPALASDILVDGETYAGAKDGSATVTSNGGTPPYTYMWSTGEVSPQLDSLENGTYVLTTTDANGCILLDSVFVGRWATGIEEELQAGFHSLTIFPNPNTGMFTLEAEISRWAELDIRVYDLSGKAILQENLSANKQFRQVIDLAKPQAGLYLIQVKTPEGVTHRKLWIQ